jgi:DNA-binding NtrC family response regulator
MRKDRLLIVDDEKDVVDIEREILEDQGYEVVTATSAVAARKLLAEQFFDLLVLDERIKGSSGTELFAESRLRYPGIGAIFVTGYADLNCAVRALRAGAIDLLQKPIDRQNLLTSVSRALRESQLSRESRFLWHDAREKTEFQDIVGESEALKDALNIVRQVIPTSAPVLLQGESGTGKELVARAIHFQGPRKNKPFIPVNAGAIPASLMEATLFGHRKGSFTDARENRPGLFEVAHGGTIFLDEVGEMTPEVQIRLLRVLQEKTVVRVGDTVEIPVDTRVIAATNRNLRVEVEERRFRDDLFYRLAVITVTLPALRVRASDIRSLALHLMNKNRNELKKRIEGIAPEALAKLEAYGWPGNIRELDNVIQRAIIVTQGNWITADAILLEGPDRNKKGGLDVADLPFSEAQLCFERKYFADLLARTGGNRTKAAKLAGIERSVLHAHLKKIGLV